ncbi:Nucleolar protein 58 [Colletotrichum siamense]|uniref:Nucleolar protein 58 n=1 Tax=Colletotrichum siamense TaxID=690259 RepID=A0A9P5EI03_COLSI|nr:Nucleolar protein 58 [Colletotrichum siamense]XP_037183199.1 Nucleolar protein 58 [Colletotrichum aenigma]KAF4828441.1 Nucleolar protein 58 [Colletotrichum tropicale]KAI8156372.1 Nucleolar protein 58 [Colletotrichum sp. SAR 10_71]KAI8160308.1 Nucleolar protein 58 [Colletotrichum sp. SAR 10_70]KAI8175247.1 Nucleolar protein 58 [Colletotrichum sp. SAR 10_75]KAI8206834.1 Nucleolar protein 58 [Colletotrichum sp. SAR 10_65]KAI8208561.1 Nucleolar protein 58 [Colletotrichum sp. SAR 10_76]KAI822
MSLFVLAETPAGYGLFKAADKKLLKRDELTSGPTSSEKINEMLKLKSFVKFDSSAVAVEEAAGLKEGRVPPLLANLLKEIKDEKKASLAVADIKLGTAIGKLPELNIQAVSDAVTLDLFRAVRENMSSLVPGLTTETMDRMALGLSHSISRHKLKFSADKVDAMVVQAIKLVDDLDKELNVYAMRTKEWYGWHFPELAKILNDNLVYARLVVAVGMRQNFAETDLSDILPEELEGPVKTAAEISMGTEITPEDLDNIQLLAQQTITYSEYRAQLSNYLETRMRALAPNLTALVGYLVGARLIAHAGSLINLAKAPSSTIQIFGAEKALFRALKTKHDTPKYGIIYHSSLVGQATGKNKGKIARSLAAKTALGLRVDALGDTENQDDEEERSILGLTNRIKLENLLRKLEGKPLLPKGVGVGPDGQLTTPGGFSLKESRKYNADADGVETNGKLIQVVDEEMKDADSEDEDEEMNDASEEEKKSKKDKKKEKKEKKRVSIAAAETPVKESKTVKGTPAKLSEKDYERLAEEAGISVSKFKRKFERGDVQLGEDGSPVVFSKKELKKLRKDGEEADATPVKESKKKRKHEDDETPKKEKKLKKKRSSLGA